MTPILSTTGGGSVRGFGRRRPVPSGPSGPSGPPSNGSFTGDAVTSLTTSNTTLNWTNADAAANVYLYKDSVFVSNLGVNATSTTQTGTLNTSYLYEVSAYKNGIESAKYNMGGAKTLAAYPSQSTSEYISSGINVPAGNISPPSTWNNNNNTVWVVACGQDGQGADGGQGGGSTTKYNVTWNGAVAVVISTNFDNTTSFATTPSLLASYTQNDRSGGSGGAGDSYYGGGGGGSGWAANVGTSGTPADGGRGYGQPHFGGDGGDNSNGEAGSEGGGGGGRGGSGYSPGAGGAGCVRVIWNA